MAEADESDGSLARLRPRAAVVLNAELDHHDHFASLDDLHALFRAWVAELPHEGVLVLHDSLDYARRRRAAPLRRGAGGGLARARRRPRRRGHALRAGGSRPRRRCPLRARRARARTTRSMRPLRWRCSTGRASAPSARRRRSRRSAARPGATSAGERWPGIRLVDDYAHHPSELAATLAAARGEAAPGRLLACFQPHMPWRTRMFADGFAEALRLADAACVCDVYVARGAADPGRHRRADRAERAAPGPGVPDRLDAGVRRRGRLDRAHGAAGRPRADARRRAGRRRARARARAAGMSAPPPAVEADAGAGAADDDRHGRPGALPGAADASAPQLTRGAGLGRRRGARRRRDRARLQPAGRGRGLRRRRAAARGRAGGDRDRRHARALRRRRVARGGRAPLPPRPRSRASSSAARSRAPWAARCA